MAELRPREGAYVVVVNKVHGYSEGLPVLGPVDREDQPVQGPDLDDSWAVVVGHPMEALGGHPAPERYTEAGVNRPRVFFGFVSTPDPDTVLTEEVINQLADQARAVVMKRLKDQAAMEKAAEAHQG